MTRRTLASLVVLAALVVIAAVAGITDGTSNTRTASSTISIVR